MFPRTFLLLAATLVPAVHSLTNYANDFIDPNYVLAKGWNYTTLPSQKIIIQWANQATEGGPWSASQCVTGAMFSDICFRCHVEAVPRSLRGQT